MVGEDFSITHITFKKGVIRGNHYHKKTKQIDVILKGKVECHHQTRELHPLGHYYIENGIEIDVKKKGDITIHYEKSAHAYKALEDSEMVSICIGKRIGKNYAKDTYKCELIS